MDICYSIPKLACQIGFNENYIGDTSIDFVIWYTLIFTKSAKYHSQFNLKDFFDAKKKYQSSVSD